MKHLYTAILATIVTLTRFGVGIAEEIHWYSFEKGFERARTQKKPIVVNFYAQWCHWCRVMAQTTFNDPTITKKLNTEYIAIKIDIETKQTFTYRGIKYTPSSFARAVGVEGLPSLLFLDKNGAIITKLGGYIRPQTFAAILDYIKDECYLNQVPFADYMSGKKNCKKAKKE
ncbi:MAG: thioredoxin family protein [Spirochaetes bacterium]|nr:thioredoxin family protein [Spirochaetota bacterium]